MTLVSSFVAILEQFSLVMTKPTFNSFVTLLTGWVFARRRTVTGMLLAAGAVGSKHHSAFHRVFSKSCWSLDDLGFAVLELVWPWVRNEKVTMLAIDDTLARKRGLNIFGVSMHHDPLRSTRKTSIKSWGHDWVVLSVIVKFPFCKNKFFSLPILFRLYVSKKTNHQKNCRHHTRPELAVEMLETLCKRHGERCFHVVADSTYGGQSVLKYLPDNCDLTSRLSLDARLYDAPPRRQPGTNGRPRKRGKRLPTPRQMLEQRTRHVTLNIYGRHDCSRVANGLARWYALPNRPLQIVAVQPLSGGRKRQAFYSTCYAATAKQVLTWYARRWSLEETFQAAKTHLGFEEPQGWTKLAVQRTAPTAMLLYSLMVLWFASVGRHDYQAPYRPWYRHKTHPSFADMVATLRRTSLKEQVLSLALSGQGSRKVTELVLHAAQQAA